MIYCVFCGNDLSINRIQALINLSAAFQSHKCRYAAALFLTLGAEEAWSSDNERTDEGGAFEDDENIFRLWLRMSWVAVVDLSTGDLLCHSISFNTVWLKPSMNRFLFSLETPQIRERRLLQTLFGSVWLRSCTEVISAATLNISDIAIRYSNWWCAANSIGHHSGFGRHWSSALTNWQILQQWSSLKTQPLTSDDDFISANRSCSCDRQEGKA